jgi:transglutaminase-like putative cysteine protease
MKKSRRVLSMALSILMLFFIAPLHAAAAEPSMDNFAYEASYTPGQFSDISENEWFGYQQQKVVCKAYELGLMQGRGTEFDPEAGVTLAEVITMAARLHHIYHGGDGKFVQTDPWYQVYVDYALENDIIQEEDFPELSAPSTRAAMSYIFARALPREQFIAINTIGALPDVGYDTAYQESILQLYRAGILTGNDAYGTFGPDGTFTRAQAAALVTRIALPGERKALQLVPTNGSEPHGGYPVWAEEYTPGMRIDLAEDLYELILTAGVNLISDFEILLDDAAYETYLNDSDATLSFLSFGNNASQYDYETQVFQYHADYTVYHQIQAMIFNRSAAFTQVPSQLADYDTQMTEALDGIIAAGMTDYQKIKAVHDYMVVQYRYDTDYLTGRYGEDTYTFAGLLQNGTGVCQAYAELFYLYLSYLNIECYVVTGLADGGTGLYEDHAWNVVLLDGEYVHVDVTFDDPVPDRGIEITYDYFLLTDEEIAEDHSWD